MSEKQTKKKQFKQKYLFECNEFSRMKYNELLYDYNRLDSLYKEQKQTIEEDYERYLEQLDTLEHTCFEEQYQKCLYRRKFHQLSIINKQLQNKKNLLESQKNTTENQTNDYFEDCCNLCYEKIEDNEKQYSFRCENKKCNKLFHTKCILKINEEKRNQCCYCKVSYKNYNFIPTQFFLYEERQDLDYLVYDKDNFDYSQPYFYWIANFYKIDKQKLNKIIKIQSYYRGRLTRKKLQCKNIQAEIQRKYSYYIQNSISNYNFVENDI